MPFPIDGLDSSTPLNKVTQGISDFTNKKAREDRRKLSKNFWQDR